MEHAGQRGLMWMMEQAGKKNSNNASFQLWQQHNQPIELRTVEMLQQKMDYIHNNPVTAGIVDKAEEYLYNSARDYYFGKYCGLFKIVFPNRFVKHTYSEYAMQAQEAKAQSHRLIR